MSTENNGSVTVAVALKEENPSFLTNSVEFKKLKRELGKLSKSALDVLENLLASEDEKMRYQAAKAILDLDVQVTKEINQDQMSRMIAELKLNRQPQMKLVQTSQQDEEDKPKRPVVDFATIRSIE